MYHFKFRNYRAFSKTIFKLDSLISERLFSVSSISNSAKTKQCENNILTVCGCDYIRDETTNVTPHILNYVDRKLHLLRNHPLNLIKQRLVNFVYGKYVNRRGNAIFSVYDKFDPVVKIEQNFDSLLIPSDHVSRSKTDTYYVNSNHVLRTHTSAHQSELIKSGLDSFIVIGDVYRRDEIDAKHFPVFHQAEGVRLFSSLELFNSCKASDDLKLFENDVRKPEKQECHTMEAVKLLEHDLKSCLSDLSKSLFGSDIQYRWIDTYFPFTHPSWELEIKWNDQWIELLGCGIMEQKILKTAGAGDKIGWAFGLGLERFAMLLYDISDIRVFWSQDSGFLSQFNVKDAYTPVKYKAISKYPQCTNDMSFWVPDNFHPNDFYDVVRSTGGDLIEQVNKIDEFFHPKKQRKSFCFRIIYRSMDHTLTQTEVTEMHNEIGKVATKELGIEIRQ